MSKISVLCFLLLGISLMICQSLILSYKNPRIFVVNNELLQAMRPEEKNIELKDLSWNMTLLHWVTGSPYFEARLCSHLQRCICPRRIPGTAGTWPVNLLTLSTFPLLLGNLLEHLDTSI